MSGSIFTKALAVAAFLGSAGVAQAAETLLTLTPRPGATVRVVTDRPASPIGSVILLAGDSGVLDIDANGVIHSNLTSNQLIRTRAMYLKAGYAYFAPGIASDLKGTNGYRFNQQHAQDLVAVVAEAAKLGPVAVIGTSRGAISAVDVFAKGGTVAAQALVISSGALIDHKGGAATTVGSLQNIRVPVLLLRHAQDFCKVTPPGDADQFKPMLTSAPKVEIITMTGGGPAPGNPDPCGASHYHGFYGMDDKVVQTTVDWLKVNLKR
jgi:hypothetical protein